MGNSRRDGFTLVELLITIMIIGIMAVMVLFAMFQAQETAKEHKTRALITKLNTIIMRRYDEYRTRRVPYVFPSIAPAIGGVAQKQALDELSRARVDCLRDLMRMEMPDRWSDVSDPPVAPFQHGISTSILPQYVGTMTRPAVSQAYYDRWNAASPKPTNEHQGAECLYMIVMGSLAQEGDSRDFFKPADVRDTDGDGFPEFVDAWNQPIEFIRWAPGYLSAIQTPIRLEGAVTQGANQSATVSVTGSYGIKLNQSPGFYVGGAIAFLRNNNTQMDYDAMGRITGYKYDNATNPPTVIFTCATLDYTDQLPFSGQSPNGQYVVLPPDPFDARGAYPLYSNNSSRPTPDTSVPSYAIYPLIHSRGKDRAMGVKDGMGSAGTLQYTQERLNPFYYGPAISPGDNYPLLIGTVPSQESGEPGWYQGCHLDNITSHDAQR